MPDLCPFDELLRLMERHASLLEDQADPQKREEDARAIRRIVCAFGRTQPDSEAYEVAAQAFRWANTGNRLLSDYHLNSLEAACWAAESRPLMKRVRELQAAANGDRPAPATQKPRDTETASSPMVGDQRSASGSLATCAELAWEYGTDPEATRKALGRWRKSHAGGDGYKEMADCRPNEPQFLYDRRVVAHVLDGLQRRRNQRDIRRTKTSGQRPAKEFER